MARKFALALLVQHVAASRGHCSLSDELAADKLCHATWTYYSCTCPSCNLTQPCASDSRLQHCACPPGTIDDSHKIFVYPPFSPPWFTRFSVIDFLLGGFFGVCWNIGMWPQVAALMLYIIHTLRHRGCSDKSVIDAILHLAIFLAFSSPGVILPLGCGPAACIIAWSIPSYFTFRWLRQNRERILRELSRRSAGRGQPHGQTATADAQAQEAVHRIPIGRPVAAADLEVGDDDDGVGMVVVPGRPVAGRAISPDDDGASVGSALPVAASTLNAVAGGLPHATSRGAIELADRLRQLDEAHAAGALSDDEHREMKRRVLEQFAAGGPPRPDDRPAAAGSSAPPIVDGHVVQAV